MPSLGITVNTASDIADAETLTIAGLELDPGPDGVVSLREALLAAHAAGQPGSPVQIVLNNEAGLRILIDTALPSISVSNLEIIGNGAVLDGSACLECTGIDVTGASNIFDALTLIGFSKAGFQFRTPNAINNLVSNCVIGLFNDSPYPNGIGLLIHERASKNTIEHSVISGNRYNGIVIFGPKTTGNKLLGNYIGVTRDGQSAITNGYEYINGFSYSFGISVYDAPETLIGQGPDRGNLISSYHSGAISLNGPQSVYCKIQANRIELQPTVIGRIGDVSIVSAIGIGSGASFVDVGGPEAGDSNYIEVFPGASGISIARISSTNAISTSIRVQNNDIRLADGPTELSPYGIQLSANAEDIMVGPGNTITNFANGILVREGAERIQIFQNSIFGNIDTGILTQPLANGGVQPPVISAGAPYTGQTVPCGLVDFYADEGGQGRLYLGAQYADADGGFALRAPEDVPEGLNITTIVTDRLGNSSAFSAPVPVAQLPRGPLEAAPALGPCARFYYHAADPSRDYDIDLSELLRGIQLYNALAYHCDTAAEDGYAPGDGAQDCAAHTLDYNPQDWRISMSELLRAIQFYNTPGGYAPCDTGEDGFCPATAG
jgi:hypothetical protein